MRKTFEHILSGIDPNLGGSNVEVESEEFIKSDEND
jgi:hypothetical protein